MAAEDGAVKQSKQKTKHEKKKRKLIEVEADAPVAKTKKSKLAEDSTTRHKSNGQVLVHRTSSPVVQSQKDTNGSNGLHDQAVNASDATTMTPRKKKDKSKLSQMNSQVELPVLTSPERDRPSPVSTKKSKNPTDQSTGLKSPPPSNKKVKSHSQIEKLSAPNEPTPMEIDDEVSQPSIYISDTPFIQCTVDDILSVALFPPQSEIRNSPFFHQTTRFYVPVSPVTLSSALEGACAEHLSPLLLKYYSPLHGVVLSYAHPRFTTPPGEYGDPSGQALAISVAEYTTPMVWLEAELLLFKPVRGHAVEGVIVLQSESYVGLQVYNLFSGRIACERLPSDWTWNQAATNKGRSRKGKLKGGRDEGPDAQQGDVEAQVVHDDMGYWTDGTGKKIEGVLKLWVWNVEIALGVREAERNLPTIEGTLLEDSFGEDGGSGVVNGTSSKKGKKKA